MLGPECFCSCCAAHTSYIWCLFLIHRKFFKISRYLFEFLYHFFKGFRCIYIILNRFFQFFKICFINFNIFSGTFLNRFSGCDQIFFCLVICFFFRSNLPPAFQHVIQRWVGFFPIIYDLIRFFLQSLNAGLICFGRIRIDFIHTADISVDHRFDGIKCLYFFWSKSFTDFSSHFWISFCYLIHSK